MEQPLAPGHSHTQCWHMTLHAVHPVAICTVFLPPLLLFKNLWRCPAPPTTVPLTYFGLWQTDDDTSPGQLLASGSDGTNACFTEALACALEPTCAGCVPEADDDDGQCDNYTATCSQFVDRMCCVYGDSCSDNSLLVAFVGKAWAPSPISSRLSNLGAFDETVLRTV